MKNLKGYQFKSAGGIDYVILYASESGEILFQQQDGKGALCFGCDAKLTDKGLHLSYNVSCSVTKQEFFEAISNGKLYSKYYKIPKVFLALVEKLYSEEK